MGAEHFPSSSRESDAGDVISEADYASLEGILPDNAEGDGFAEQAAAAAGGMIDADEVIIGYGSPQGLAKLDAISTVNDEPSAVTKRYDRFSEEVEKLVDKQIDRKIAEYQLDPTGEIRRDHKAQEGQRQASLNRLMVEDMRKQAHDAAMAKINQIADPRERELAEARLLASERNAARRRRSKA